MSDGIIYDTNFYAALEAEVNAFRKALTKRWRNEVATAIREHGEFKTAFRRYQTPYDGDLWDYWDPISQVHLTYGSCEVLTWATGDQQSGVPPPCHADVRQPVYQGILFLDGPEESTSA
ncbi:hypothetical protein [Actinoplanes sp. NPDC049802]|uniref:hypothetical protein n=1 Tax=Actinoplanes sp. NPDC049802 TaxID=3154742 RepID=UPI0033CDE4B6